MLSYISTIPSNFQTTLQLISTGIGTTGVAAMPTAGFARNSLTLRRATSETSMVGIGGICPPRDLRIGWSPDHF